MTYKTAICDDDPESILAVKHMLESFHFETGIEFNITSYTDPDKFVSDYNSPNTYDIIFLDVEMQDKAVNKNGIEVARYIRSMIEDHAIIIFVSNYPEYMNLGYDVRAAHYLPKDISPERFKEVMNNILLQKRSDNSLLCVKTGRGEKQLLRINEIIYVKALPYERKKIVYVTKHGEKYSERQTILAVSEILGKHSFALANQYYLVNLRFVRKLVNDDIILENQEKISLSKHYKSGFITHFSNSILNIID